MTGKILIAHRLPASAAQLEASLVAAGYEVCHAATVEAARQLLHRYPDLLLLDPQLAADSEPETLAALAEELEFAETFCLRLDLSGGEYSQLQQQIPFACGTIALPGVKEQILEQITTLFRIKRAEAERNLAQERLVLYRREVEEGLRSAAHIQHTLLPNHLQNTSAFSFAWQFIPCETVGGDLFNAQSLSEDVLMVYMLDVSGHGVSSAIVTVSVQQSLSDRTGQLVKQPTEQAPFYHIVSPAKVITALDQEYPYERFDKFFTISYLLLEPATGKVRYCNGGHPPPILIRKNGDSKRLEAGGTLIGLGGIIPYEEAEITLQPGDRIYLYSDGITEHEAPSGEMFGEQRLIDFFSHQAQIALNEAASLFITSLRDFGAGAAPVDDISLFCIQFNGKSTK